MTSVIEAPDTTTSTAAQVSAPCPLTPWCVKGDGHPEDKPGSWSACTSERLPYPTTCHNRAISHVFAERDADEALVVVEHTDESNDTAILIYLDEAEELVAQLQATIARVKAAPPAGEPRTVAD